MIEGGFDNDATFKIILRPSNINYIQLFYTKQKNLFDLSLYSTLKTLAWLSHFMDSLQDFGSSILVAPVSSYRPIERGNRSERCRVSWRIVNRQRI